MKRANPGLALGFAVLGVVIEQIIQRSFGGNVVLLSLIILFCFLIGLAWWNKKNNTPKNPN
jgi:hypothetical protein